MSSHVLCSISIAHPSISSFALLSLVLSLIAIPKVDLRSEVGGKHCHARAARRGDGGAGRRCERVFAPSHPWPGIVHTCRPDHDGVRMGIAPSQLVNGPCEHIGDTSISSQEGISIFKFPERFLEMSCRDLISFTFQQL